jgi:hypothetical protein
MAKEDALLRTKKEKSTKGFVWVETDPFALLVNKSTMLVDSCHCLTSGYQYRGGNLLHVYNPYMAGLYCHRFNPSEVSLIPAVTRDEGRAITNPDGQTVMTREFQSTRNLFLVLTEENEWTIYMGIPYDTCSEYPWTETEERYLSETCEQWGIGLAKQTYGSSNLISPNFSLPWHRTVPDHYQDGVSYKGDRNDNYGCAVSGEFILYPGNQSRLPKPPQRFGSGDYVTATVYLESPGHTYRCDDCGCGLQEDDIMSSEGGGTYCSTCYEDRYFYCDSCAS